MQIRSATDALGYATAALAASSRGARALAVDQLGAAQTAIENLINLYVRSERTKGARRKPYGYRARITRGSTRLEMRAVRNPLSSG